MAIARPNEAPPPAVSDDAAIESQGVPLPQARGVTLRALLLSIPLVAINCYWVLEIEGIWHSNHATAMSLFWNTTFFLLSMEST